MSDLNLDRLRQLIEKSMRPDGTIDGHKMLDRIKEMEDEDEEVRASLDEIVYAP